MYKHEGVIVHVSADIHAALASKNSAHIIGHRFVDVEWHIEL